jgi:hypothetical protein
VLLVIEPICTRVTGKPDVTRLGKGCRPHVQSRRTQRALKNRSEAVIGSAAVYFGGLGLNYLGTDDPKGF